jgi:hypothetical protein
MYAGTRRPLDAAAPTTRVGEPCDPWTGGRCGWSWRKRAGGRTAARHRRSRTDRQTGCDSRRSRKLLIVLSRRLASARHPLPPARGLLLAACRFAFGADHRSFTGQDVPVRCPFSGSDAASRPSDKPGKHSCHLFAQARTTTSHRRPGQPGPTNRPAVGKRRMAARRVRGRPRRQHPARPPTGSFPPFFAGARVARPVPQKNLRHSAGEWPRRLARDPAVPVPPANRRPHGPHRRSPARRAQ